MEGVHDFSFQGQEAAQNLEGFGANISVSIFGINGFGTQLPAILLPALTAFVLSPVWALQ